ncbi:hypothetical protein Anapl_06465 [Anas platyrhynchos]|uniref:Uncharacterized protein n=1 Tax=Anas platyrhynchos TaxID=8839 RepID=R0L0U1_ANAPL|nr:hypothetical protein Anapl_06465 [Anas platyrhynchos]
MIRSCSVYAGMASETGMRSASLRNFESNLSGQRMMIQLLWLTNHIRNDDTLVNKPHQDQQKQYLSASNGASLTPTLHCCRICGIQCSEACAMTEEICLPHGAHT